MQNDNVKLNQILGTLLVILCIVIVFLLYKRQTYDVNQDLVNSAPEEGVITDNNSEAENNIGNEENNHEVTITIRKPLLTTKPQTNLGGLGCFLPPGEVCNDMPPTHVTLNGHYESNDKETKTWFVYYRMANNTSPEGPKVETTKRVHTESSGDVSEYVTYLDAGYTYTFTLVGENSRGISYGAPITSLYLYLKINN